jgi:hypothetical protein
MDGEIDADAEMRELGRLIVQHLKLAAMLDRLMTSASARAGHKSPGPLMNALRDAANELSPEQAAEVRFLAEDVAAIALKLEFERPVPARTRPIPRQRSASARRQPPPLYGRVVSQLEIFGGSGNGKLS